MALAFFNTCMETIVGSSYAAPTPRSGICDRLVSGDSFDLEVGSAAKLQPRRSPSLTTCRNVAYRWGIPLCDAAEICNAFEQAQSGPSVDGTYGGSELGSDDEDDTEDLRFIV